MSQLAYYDSFSGLVPVRVLAVREGCKGFGEGLAFDLQVTAKRGPYKRGDRIEGNALRTVPRPAVYKRRGGSWRILPYAWREILAPAEIQGEGAAHG